MNETAAHTEIKFEITGFSWDDGLMVWAREHAEMVAAIKGGQGEKSD